MALNLFEVSNPVSDEIAVVNTQPLMEPLLYEAITRIRCVASKRP